MREVFTSQIPPDDMRAFSGILYFMSRAIKEVTDKFENVVTPAYNLSTMFVVGVAELVQVKACGEFLSRYLEHSDADAVIARVLQ